VTDDERDPAAYAADSDVVDALNAQHARGADDHRAEIETALAAPLTGTDAIVER